MKVLTRRAANSVSEIATGPRILAPRGPGLEARTQSVFDHEQPAEFLGRHPPPRRPARRCARDQRGAGAPAELPTEPRCRVDSMGAAERLKTGRSEERRVGKEC